MARMLGWRIHACLPFTECWKDWRQYGDPAGIFVRRVGEPLHCCDHQHGWFLFPPLWWQEMMADRALARAPRAPVTEEQYAEELRLISEAEREWTRIHGMDA